MIQMDLHRLHTVNAIARLIQIFDFGTKFSPWTQCKQECIPVRCVPPARYRTGGLHDRDPPGQRPPWTETHLDRDPLDRDPPRQRPLKDPPDRDPPDKNTPGWRHPPGQRSHLDRDPTQNRDPPPGQRPRPPPLWTDGHLWKHNNRKLRLRAVKIYS